MPILFLANAYFVFGSCLFGIWLMLICYIPTLISVMRIWHIRILPSLKKLMSQGPAVCIYNLVLVAKLGFLAKISFTIIPPKGFLGCSEKRTISRNYNLFVWSHVFFQPKWNDIKKTLYKLQKSIEKLLGFFLFFF